jgi:hypothetical protein
MTERRLLHLDPSRLTVYRWRGGHLNDEGSFSVDEAGVAAFAAYAQAHSGSLFSLLADLPEEGFQADTIPYVQGADRRALIDRKLAQFFYGSPYAVAVSLGRERTGRRDERMLFLALTRLHAIGIVTASLRAAEAPLAGVYTASLAAWSLARALRLKADGLLLVTLGSAGIHQTYLEGGKLRFARLTPVAHPEPAELARLAMAESERISQYLTAQRVINRETPLPVLVVAHPDHHAAFSAVAGAASGDLSFEMLDLVQAARRCGLKNPVTDSSCDPLLLHLLARRPPAIQLAQAAERRFYRLWQMRAGVSGAGLAVLFACLLFAGRQLYEAHDLSALTAELIAQTQADNQRYADILRGLPRMPTTLDNLRAVTQRYQALAARSTTIEGTLRAISAAIEQSPKIELERIDWMLSTNAEDTGDPMPARGGGDERGTAAAQPAMYAVAIVAGALPPSMIGDQRGLLAAVNDFVAALRRDPQARVTVLQMPFDVESGKTLRSGSDGARTVEAPRFTVRVSYPLREQPE